MYPTKQSTALDVLFFAHDANGDAVTGKVDGDFTKRISKSGAAFAAMTVTVAERENGWYQVQLSTTHTNTLGVLSVTFTASGIKQVNLQWRVHTRIPDDLAFPATTGRSILVETDGMIHSDVKEWLAVAPNALASGRVDSTTGAMQANVVTAAAVANAAIDAATFAAGAIDAAAIANGAINAATFTAGAIDAGAIAPNAIGASELATDAVNEIRDAILADSTPFNGADVGIILTQTANVFRAVVNGTADSGSTTTLVDAVRTEADTDYWKGAWLVITSGTINGQMRKISAFNFTTDTITVDRAFTQAVGTNTYEIFPADFPNNLANLLIETDGMAHADVKEWLATTPNVLVSGRVDASVGAIAAGAIDAASIANGAIDAATFAAGAIDAAAIANGAIDAATFAAGAVDSAALATDAVNKIADGLLDRANAIETSLTLREAQRLIVSSAAGKLSGAATTTVLIRNAIGDSKNRITATVDASGNRTAVTTDVT